MGRTTRSTRRTAVILAAVAALTLATVSTAQAVERVKATGSQTFRPKKLQVGTGTRVVWKSVSGTHTVTAYSNNWSKNTTISTGDTTSFTFSNAGRYKYRCTFHSTLSNGVCTGMCGKVIVG